MNQNINNAAILCSYLPYKPWVHCTIKNMESSDSKEQFEFDGQLFSVNLLGNCVQVYPDFSPYTYEQKVYLEDFLNRGYSSIEWCKLYLRPLTSMTKKEAEELTELTDCAEIDLSDKYFPGIKYREGGTFEEYLSTTSFNLCELITNWLKEHKFDYMNLISQDAALEAKPEMYKF